MLQLKRFMNVVGMIYGRCLIHNEIKMYEFISMGNAENLHTQGFFFYYYVLMLVKYE